MHATRRRTTRTATQKGKAARAIPSEPQPQPQHEPPRHLTKLLLDRKSAHIDCIET